MPNPKNRLEPYFRRQQRRLQTVRMPSSRGHGPTVTMLSDAPAEERGQNAPKHSSLFLLVILGLGMLFAMAVALQVKSDLSHDLEWPPGIDTSLSSSSSSH